MVRTTHFSQPVGLPVYAVEFVAPRVVAYVGGGGASKSGLKNKLVLAALEEEVDQGQGGATGKTGQPGSSASASASAGSSARLSTLAEILLSAEEDAPMCMAVDRVGGIITCSVNSPPSALAKGENRTLRLFRYTLPARWQDPTSTSHDVKSDRTGDEKATLEAIDSYRGLPITNPEDYPKVLALAPPVPTESEEESAGTRISAGPALLEAGTDGSVAVHHYPAVGEAPFWAAAGPPPTSASASASASAVSPAAASHVLAATGTQGSDPLFSPGDEIYDADFAPSGAVVALAAAHSLRIFSTMRVSTSSAAAMSSSSSLSSPSLSRPSSPADSAEQEPGNAETEAQRAAQREAREAEEEQEEEDKDQNKDGPVVLQTITNPEVGAGGRGTFRAARFSASGKVLYTVVNASAGAGSGKGSGRGRGNSGSGRAGYVSVWDVDQWALRATRKVGDKPVTAFAVSSAAAAAVAVGGADLSVSVLDAGTLRLRTQILATHSFPPTSLAFSPDGAWLVSGSADNTLRCIRVPSAQEAAAAATHSTVLAALALGWFVLLLAVYLARRGET